MSAGPHRRRMSSRAPWLLLLLALLCVCAECAPARAQQYTFAQFGQTDGLLNQDVSALVQDNRGVLWVGTENGLFQADGSHFVRVESYADAAYGSVLAMHVDAGGRVWVLGEKRLVFYASDGTLHGIPGADFHMLLDRNAAMASLPEAADTLFLMKDGELSVLHSPDGGSTWGSRPVFDAAVLSAHPALRQLVSLTADPDRHSLWAGCGRGLCEIHPLEDGLLGARVAEWTESRGVPANTWTSLLLEADERLLARGSGAVLRLDPASGKIEQLGDPSGGTDPLPHYAMLLLGPDGAVLANLSDGLAIWKAKGWQRFQARNGLPPSPVQTMFFDRSGGFWLAPVGQGIWRWLGYGNWQHWTRSEGLSGNVTWNMLRDTQGRFWVATDNLDLLDAVQGKAVPQIAGKPLDETQTIATDTRGHIWVGDSDGTLRDYDPGTRKTRIVARDLGFLYRLGMETAHPGSQDVAGARIWICSSSGLAYVSEEDRWAAMHPVREPDAPQSHVWGMTEDPSGALWFTAQGGIYRLAAGIWTRMQLPAPAMAVNYPVMEAAPDGSFWMQAAMPTPLLHLRAQGAGLQVIGSVPASLIGSDDVSFIQVDRRGWLWVGTDLGVYVFDGLRWIHCTQEDGLLSDDTDTASVFEDGDGSMWFGTASGLSHLLHPQELFRVPAPSINVREVRLNGTALVTGQRPSFAVRQPELTVQLFSTYYKRPRAVSFRYRLTGLENEWQTTTAGEMHFSSLPPGDYTLSVQAVDQRIHAFSTPVDYSFTVLPPWYKRDRSKLLAFCLLLLLGAAGWQISLRRLKASEAILKAKVDHQTAQLLEEKKELERTQRELLETSRRDALTGLLNRSAIFDILLAMRRRALIDGTPLSVIMADLDHFKSINDRFGHTTGDAVLQECAERFRETLRPGDAIGRYGGEELLLVIPGLNMQHAAARMEEIRAAIAARPVIHGSHTIWVTCSFGVAWLNEHHRDLQSVVNAADAALYLAKQNGRNRVEFTPDSAEEAFAMPVAEAETASEAKIESEQQS